MVREVGVSLANVDGTTGVAGSNPVRFRKRDAVAQQVERFHLLLVAWKTL